MSISFRLTLVNSECEAHKQSLQKSAPKEVGRMRKTVLVLIAGVLWAPVSFAATEEDVAAPIRQFIDGFNKGNTASANAAYAKGEITIMDEFAPHHWSGPHAAQEWASAYDKHAQATGVSTGQVKYGAPTRIEREGELAYIILPTEYLY